MPAFFDLLPLELNELIAKLLLPPPRLLLPQSYESLFFEPKPALEEGKHVTLLNYAKVGDKQRTAVMKALHYKLFPYNLSFKTLEDWVLTCHDSIHEINLENVSGISLEPGFLNLPNLRRCTIRGVPDQLSAIAGCPRLSNVAVTVIRASLWGEIVNALGTLPITTLTFQVRIYGRMRTIDRLPTAQLALLCQACPNITNLQLMGRVAMTTNLCTMLSSFPMLRKLGLDCNVDEGDIECMQNLDEVDLYKSKSIQVAARLGKSLVGVAQEDVAASAMDIEKFSECPNLRRLLINLNENAEAALVGKIGNVENLCLAWTRTLDGGQEDAGPVIHNFFEPNGEVLEDIIRSTPKLKSLVIARAVVREAVLTRILQICGIRLTNIEVHVDKQGVPIPVRVETILRTASYYCFNLRTLWLLEEGSSPNTATSSQKEKCFKALKALMEAAPELMCHRNIESYIEDRMS